jgi:hypothetical protein
MLSLTSSDRPILQQPLQSVYRGRNARARAFPTGTAGGRRLLAEQRKSLQDLLQVHDLPWHELGNGESDYVY